MDGICASVAVLLVLLLAVPASAQQEKGDKELQLNANLSVTSGGGSSTGNGSVNILLGYYLTRQFEIRGGTGIGIMALQACSHTQSSAGVLTCTAFDKSQVVGNPTFTAGAVFNFAAQGQKVAPYIGGDYSAIGVHSAGALKLTSSTTFSQNFPLNWTSNIRPNGGIKFFIKRNIALDINVGWEKDLGDNSSGLNTFDTRIGFSYVF